MAIEDSGAVVTHDPLPRITADGGQLVQIFQNLIGNGIKFRDEAKPRVHVSARNVTDEWTFSVRDNGIGIDPEFHDDVFKMFKRLNAPEAFGEGTGAGLSFVQKVIEGNGGEIRLHSVPGEGSTFYFTFPDPGGPPPREEGNNE